MKPRKHAELIKAWADGATIQRLWTGGHWLIDNEPMWEEWEEYRIKPEPKPDVVRTLSLFIDKEHYLIGIQDGDNLKLTFDGETGELKSAEVLK